MPTAIVSLDHNELTLIVAGLATIRQQSEEHAHNVVRHKDYASLVGVDHDDDATAAADAARRQADDCQRLCDRLVTAMVRTMREPLIG